MQTLDLCQACASGEDKYKHNFDTQTCRFGKLEVLLNNSKDPVEDLHVMECMPLSMAYMIVGLAKERNKTILAVMQEEKLA